MPQFSPRLTSLIYNPASGIPDNSGDRLTQVLALLDEIGIHPKVLMARKGDEIIAAAAAAMKVGNELVIVCGGDSTVESAANILVGTPAILGILPTGTRNNVAASLNIPSDLAEATRLLRSGRQHAIDTGLARCGRQQRWFLETFTAGLFSTLYPDADAIQKGDIGRVGNLLLEFVNATASEMHLNVDGGAQELDAMAHALLGLNMPYTGGHFQLAAGVACDDGQLDIFVYDRLDKLDLLAYGFDVVTGVPEDPAIRRIHARDLSVRTEPPMCIMADGFLLGEGAVEVHLAPHSLNVIVGSE